MSPELWIAAAALVGGFIFNSLVTIGAFFRFALANEKRMSRIETHLSHLLLVVPKRRGDMSGEGAE